MQYTNENVLLGNNSTHQATLSSRNEVKLISTSNFLGREINVYGSVDNPLFLAGEVAEWIEHSNVTEMLRSIDDEEKLTSTILRAGQRRDCNFLTEDGLYEVLFLSRKPIAKQFKKGVKEILKSIRRTGEFSSNNRKDKQTTISEKMKAATWAAKFLNLNDSSKLIIAKQILEPYNLPLPDYTPSKGVLKSASELLKENGCTMSAQTFNAKLIELGYLVEFTRPSRAYGKAVVKKFKSITAKGLEYGENQVNPNNPKSTQPLWYADRFNELLALAR